MPTDVAAVVQDTLDVASGAIDAPDRVYVAHAQPAIDCEQLTAHLALVRAREMDPNRGGDFAPSCLLVWAAQVVLELWRCVPVQTEDAPPPAADIASADKALISDGMAITRALSRARADGSWPEGLACSNVRFGPLEPLQEQGGYAGWRLSVEVQLD
jgi:hypothetical protein